MRIWPQQVWQEVLVLQLGIGQEVVLFTGNQRNSKS